MKFLGLVAMSKLVNTYPKAVQAHIDLIIACLNDKNESIRHQALDLLGGMVKLTKKYSLI